MPYIFGSEYPTYKIFSYYGFQLVLSLVELTTFYYQNVKFETNMELFQTETPKVKFITANSDTYPVVLNSQHPDQAILAENEMSAWTCALYSLGANVTPPIIYQFQVWRLFTCQFLHNNFKHFWTNCLSRILFWASLTNMIKNSNIKARQQIFYYFVSGVFGNIVSSFFLPVDLSIGSSSSVFGLVGMNLSLIVYFKFFLNANLNKNLYVLLVQIMIITILSFFGQCDHFAHMGGFISGFILFLNYLITHQNSIKNTQSNNIVSTLYYVLLLQIISGILIHFLRLIGNDEYELLSIVDMGCDTYFFNQTSVRF